MSTNIRKTPEEATDFEREQFLFFLAQDDLSKTLTTLNPSLAWLPILSQTKLVQSERQLVPWIEQNFSDVRAVRDVVANLRFFGVEAANLLAHRLDANLDGLDPVLIKSWRLIIRQMRAAARDRLQVDWFEIAPRIKRGEVSPDLLTRLVAAIAPKMRLGRKLFSDGEADQPLTSPSQLMSIDFEPDEYPTADEVLATWPEGARAEIDSKLLTAVTNALDSALEEATDAGVEGEVGYGTSDFDVPSIAEHDQNKNRTGFQSIVRVIASVWERLARKSAEQALEFANIWRSSRYRLVRRLNLFACTHSIVPSENAASSLLDLPLGELFLTSSSVEVIQLIRARWNNFSARDQKAVFRRLRAGPPGDWFRSEASKAEHIDRARFDVLAEMARQGIALDVESAQVLQEIRERWPLWELRPARQAGFHIWSESGWVGDRDETSLDGVQDEKLVDAAKGLSAKSEFYRGDSWRGLCTTDPDRALRGLDFAASIGDWPVDLWGPLLWANRPYSDPTSERRIAELLLEWPSLSFTDVVVAASFWMNEHAKTLDDSLLWRLWDRIAAEVLAPAKGGSE